MSKETQLKKEFSEKDLKRIRNIVEKRYDDSTGIQVGYEKSVEDYKEGDVWEENDKTWTIKNGIKQTVTKMDTLKNSFKIPLVCPCCKTHFKIFDLNKKMYNMHGKCLDCVIEMETKLKLEGTYDEYEKNMMNGNRDSFIEEFENVLEEYSNSKNETFVTEDGKHENWIGGGVDNEYIKIMKEQIKEQKKNRI